MAYTKQYYKTCEHCGGDWLRLDRKPGSWFLGGWYIYICQKCNTGKVFPKEVIHHPNKIEPTVIYE